MKSVLLLTAALGLAGCASTRPSQHAYGDDMIPAPRSYGNDALPSAEVTAFLAMDARLKYRDARIERDPNGCAVYQGIAANGRTKREPLLDPTGKPICARN